MSDVEKLVAYNGIRAYLTEVDQKDLLGKLNLDIEQIKHRLGGLNIETEFYLILHLLESCKHILSFDEGTSVLTNSYSADSLLALKNEQKILVEIKSKADFDYSISGGNLQKRIAFADEFGYKLYFAVRLKGFWGLYSSDYLIDKGGKLKFPDDYYKSDFETVFNSHMIIFPEGIKIINEYSHDGTALAGIKHPVHGNLIKYEFYFKNKLLFVADKTDVESETRAVTGIVLEALHDEMSKQSQETIMVENGNTRIVEKLTLNTFFYDYTFLLAPIYHTESSLGYTHDTTTFYKSILGDKGKIGLNKDILFGIIENLQSIGVPIIISKLASQQGII